MTPEEYRKKYKHLRVVYISDDGFWVDGKTVLRNLGVTHYPKHYVVPRLKPPETPVDGDLTALRIVDRVYTAYKFRSEFHIPDSMVEWMIRQGRHKTETS